MSNVLGKTSVVISRARRYHRRCIIQLNHLLHLLQSSVHVGGRQVLLVIAGDGAYPLLPWLAKAYNGSFDRTSEIDQTKRFYNARLGAARVVVKHACGRLKARWRRLLKRSEHFIFIPPMVFACAIIRNIIGPVTLSWAGSATLDPGGELTESGCAPSPPWMQAMAPENDRDHTSVTMDYPLDNFWSSRMWICMLTRHLVGRGRFVGYSFCLVSTFVLVIIDTTILYDWTAIQS